MKFVRREPHGTRSTRSDLFDCGGAMCLVEEPGSPTVAIPAMATSYTSQITDGDAALDAVLVMGLISASAPESEFHPGNCHPRCKRCALSSLG